MGAPKRKREPKNQSLVLLKSMFMPLKLKAFLKWLFASRLFSRYGSCVYVCVIHIIIIIINIAYVSNSSWFVGWLAKGHNWIQLNWPININLEINNISIQPFDSIQFNWTRFFSLLKLNWRQLERLKMKCLQPKPKPKPKIGSRSVQSVTLHF